MADVDYTFREVLHRHVLPKWYFCSWVHSPQIQKIMHDRITFSTTLGLSNIFKIYKTLQRY